MILRELSIGNKQYFDIEPDLFDYVKRLQEENKILKENAEHNDKAVEEMENQQKEFIEYLTSYIDLLSNNPDLIEDAEIDLLKEILSKYKEIIGVLDEKK